MDHRWLAGVHYTRVCPTHSTQYAKLVRAAKAARLAGINKPFQAGRRLGIPGEVLGVTATFLQYGLVLAGTVAGHGSGERVSLLV